MVYITGDIHGSPLQVSAFCREYKTSQQDVLVLLGDVGANYYLDKRDKRLKEELTRLPITLLCIHGNHEARPQSVRGRLEKQWNGGTVYYEAEYPNLLFAKDGEIYDLDGVKCMAIGGAYSVDKHYRLSAGLKWFADEQPSGETKAYVEQQLAEHSVDVILAHTCPYRHRPADRFFRGIDQKTVDTSTELWLDSLAERYPYAVWYCGHWHIDRLADGVHFLFQSVERLPGKSAFGWYEPMTVKELFLNCPEEQVAVFLQQYGFDTPQKALRAWRTFIADIKTLAPQASDYTVLAIPRFHALGRHPEGRIYLKEELAHKFKYDSSLPKIYLAGEPCFVTNPYQPTVIEERGIFCYDISFEAWEEVLSCEVFAHRSENLSELAADIFDQMTDGGLTHKEAVSWQNEFRDHLHDIAKEVFDEIEPEESTAPHPIPLSQISRSYLNDRIREQCVIKAYLQQMHDRKERNYD